MVERAVFEYLINSLWQVPVLACATWVLVRAARPALRVQHALWFAALVLAVLIPLRGIDLATHPIAENGPNIALDMAPIALDYAPQLEESFTSRLQALLVLRIHPLQLGDRTIAWLVELYGVSIAFSLARLVHSWFAARKLVAEATEHPLTTLEAALLNACAQRLRLPAERIPEIRFLPGATSPMVIGMRHPVLLLPVDLRHGGNLAFDDHTLTAILSHELAHIRRRDYLANLLARSIALPIAFHPATMALQRRIRQTREMICDAHAADAFDCSSTYARSLLALAERLLPQPSHVEAVGLFANARNTAFQTLEERIMKLTQPNLPISRTLRTVRIAAGSIALVAATATAATLHLKPAVPEVYAAHITLQPQEPQAPATPQVAAPTPPPAPAPAPTVAAKGRHHVDIVNGEQRELTPEEKAKLDKELAAASEELHKATEQFSNGELQKNIAESMKSINSDEFKKQMAEIQEQRKQFNSPEFRKQMADTQAAWNSDAMKKQMAEMQQQRKQFNSSEFRKQMADAQASVNSPELKLQMQDLKLQFDNPEFMKQVEEAKLLGLKSATEWKAGNAEARRQLEAARAAIAEARKQSTDAKVQQQLDEAQRRIDAATKKF